MQRFKRLIHQKRIFIPSLIFLAVLVLFGVYVSHYQYLINTGSALSDEHCLKINPLIIDRKNRYIDSLKVIQASGSADEYQLAMNKYSEVAKRYLNEENKWLEKQSNFGNRWDFNYMFDDSVKKASYLLFETYKNDYYSTDAIVKLIDEKDPEKQKQLEQDVMNYVKLSNNAQDEYNKLWDTHKFKYGLADYFVKVPPTKCPNSNFDFPDVFQLFRPYIPIENSGITG